MNSTCKVYNQSLLLIIMSICLLLKKYIKTITHFYSGREKSRSYVKGLMAFPRRGTPNPGVNSFKQTMYFTEEVVTYSDVCYSNAMSYTIHWREMSSKRPQPKTYPA